MKDINIALCDDIQEDIKIIYNEFKKIKLDFEYKIDIFNNPEILLNKHMNLKYDIVMLDIDMPQLTGFELAKKLKEYYNNVLIIFITSKPQLVFDSFKYRPISFLNKDALFELPSVFKDVYEELKLIYPTFDFYKDNILYNIALKDILYFKKDLNDIEIHTINEIYTIRASLKSIESKINNHTFVHLSKSLYTNSKYILNADFTNCLITLKDGEQLKFSRLYKKQIRHALCYK